MQKTSKVEGQDVRNLAASDRNSSSLHHFPELSPERLAAPVPQHLNVISELRDMDRIEHGWNGLIQPESSPYQTYGWVQAFFHNWSDWIDEMLVFTLTGESGIIAILPCYRVGNKLHLAADEISPYNDMVAIDSDAAADLVGRASSWMREYRNGCKLHFRSVREGSLVHEAVHHIGEEEVGWTYAARDSGSAESFNLKEGAESHLESLSETGAVKLREAGTFLNQHFPSDCHTILKGCEMRVNDLANAFEFFALCKAEGTDLPELDFQLFCHLGEVSKDTDLGWQIAFLTNEGEILAVSCGFAMNGVWHEFMRVESKEHERFEPAANLFLRSIEHWHRIDGLTSCDEVSSAIPVSGEIEPEQTQLLALTLKPLTMRHRICDRLIGGTEIENSEDTETFLAR